MNPSAQYSERDVEEARLLQRKLREVFRDARPGAAHIDSLGEVRRLVDRALLALDDEFCQHQICEIERHAVKFFSRSGVMFQRRVILDTLEVIQNRLFTLQQLQAAAASLARGEAVLEKR